MDIYYFWINETMETGMLIFTNIDKIILTYQANSLWLMIANNVIYLNMFQMSSASYMYPLAYLLEICPPLSFFVAFPWCPFSGAGIVSVWQRQQRVLLAPCLIHSTVTDSPGLWVKTREKRNFLSFPSQRLSNFPPQAFLYPRTINKRNNHSFQEKILNPFTRERFCFLGPKKTREN